MRKKIRNWWNRMSNLGFEDYIIIGFYLILALGALFTLGIGMLIGHFIWR